MKQISAFQRKIAEEPIKLPSNPFFDVFRTFGRDELISLIINVIATAIISKFAFSNFILSITGPIIEKIGFFIAYFKEAITLYKTTQVEKRDSLSKYIFKAIKQGSNSLMKDILFHDPTYMLLMFFGLQSYPQTPPWMLSALAFFIAVAAVAVGEVSFNEIQYILFTKRLKKIGFGKESYFESRFIIGNKNSKTILADISKEFNLSVSENINYQDRYFESSLKGYNSRTPKLRLRNRVDDKNFKNKTVQVVYSRASEMAMKKPAQFNFYPTRKDKLWIRLDQEMPWKIEDIKSKELRSLLKKLTKNNQFNDVYFNRMICRDPNTILVSVDNVRSPNNAQFTIVEMKAHTDKKSKTMLIEAMRYLMMNYPVTQTTHTKAFLATIDS